MKKSLYRQVMFVLLMICLMLLIAIAIKIEVFKGLSTCVVFKTIVSIMKNSYVSSILCSILLVILILVILTEVILILSIFQILPNSSQWI